jgi:methylenetetrahydrofolate reductase (NADPH)
VADPRPVGNPFYVSAPRQPVSVFEVLPLGRSEEEARALPEPAWLTVTCSPKHGPDLTAEVSKKLRAMGHTVTPHFAARMVRDRDHLDQLLNDIAQAGIDDLFVIGGDSPEPLGVYSSAVELLDDIAEHPRRPGRIGIAAYPEGHPLIDDQTLAAALERKSRIASYVTTQMCFDADTLTNWLREARAGGLTLPVLAGMPGVVDRRRLLEISMRIGVGPSLSFVRKQRGIRKLFSRPAAEADRLYDAIAPVVQDESLNVEGFHFYTFNQLVDTWRWERGKRDTAGLAAES